MALAVADRREELAPDELVVVPPQAVVGSAVVREDEHVADLVNKSRAQQPWEIAGRRCVKTSGGDRDVGESRSAEVLESLRVQVQLRPQSPRRASRAWRWSLRRRSWYVTFGGIVITWA